MITLPPIKKRKRYLGSILRHLTTLLVVFHFFIKKIPYLMIYFNDDKMTKDFINMAIKSGIKFANIIYIRIDTT